jgi:hypothetical protein
VVELFHHPAFLKESLRLTKDKKPALSIAESLRLYVSTISYLPWIVWIEGMHHLPNADFDYLNRGALPRQLALEVLDSIQKVLFPLDDPKSRILLGSLTSTSGFNPNYLRSESSSIWSAEEKDISYYYFGAQLS